MAMNREKYDQENEVKDAGTGMYESTDENADSRPTDERRVSEDENQLEELERAKCLLEEKDRKCSEYFEKLQRAAAEFDNFKRRTSKEKEILYSEAVADTVASFLPVIDSIVRAVELCSGEKGSASVKEGIELVKRQFEEVMKNLGVEEIRSIGEEFNPELHNAVMHVEDDSYGQNEVIEEFQKGYRIKSRVIRHSMVKVAN